MATHNGRAGAPREFGRDGVSGIVTRDRAMRAREVSRPSQEDLDAAAEALPTLLARTQQRR